MNISILQICLISLFYCFSNISWPFGSMGQWATINRPLVGGLVVGLILGNPVQARSSARPSTSSTSASSPPAALCLLTPAWPVSWVLHSL